MWIAAVLASAAPATSAQDDSVLESALQYFTRHDAGDISTLFDSVRPDPVSDAERGRSLAMLPADGDLRDLDTAQRKKVAAVRRVLALHQREAIYVVKVIAVPQAAVALHDRAVVLVSAPALHLLDAEELQALVAHEVGHEYFWGEYFRARLDNSQSSFAETRTPVRRYRRHHAAARGVEPQAAGRGTRKDRPLQPQPVRSCADGK